MFLFNALTKFYQGSHLLLFSKKITAHPLWYHFHFLCNTYNINQIWCCLPVLRNNCIVIDDLQSHNKTIQPTKNLIQRTWSISGNKGSKYWLQVGIIRIWEIRLPNPQFGDKVCSLKDCIEEIFVMSYHSHIFSVFLLTQVFQFCLAGKCTYV